VSGAGSWLNNSFREAKQLAELKGKIIEWSNQIGNALKIEN
jgi:hypothetical protein